MRSPCETGYRRPLSIIDERLVSMHFADHPSDHSGDRAGHAILASANGQAFTSLLRPATPRAERYAIGRALRRRVPRSALAEFARPSDGVDPIELITMAHRGRVDWLVPVRVGRMLASP